MALILACNLGLVTKKKAFLCHWTQEKGSRVKKPEYSKAAILSRYVKRNEILRMHFPFVEKCLALIKIITSVRRERRDFQFLLVGAATKATQKTSSRGDFWRRADQISSPYRFQFNESLLFFSQRGWKNQNLPRISPQLLKCSSWIFCNQFSYRHQIPLEIFVYDIFK